MARQWEEKEGLFPHFCKPHRKVEKTRQPCVGTAKSLLDPCLFWGVGDGEGTVGTG